ncbi:MAG: hypothetical protein OJF55_000977 [Rhodanobacteraceae bacterium]|nr:MAG: hypothetical protein OJF55_000977 [Rhodanobacteraceae bacterium]
MPTVNDDFNRTVARLDLDAELSGIFTPGAAAALRFNDADLVRFNDCVARVAPGTPALDGPQIAAAARRLSRAVGAGNESRFILTRLRRACEMRALLGDANWSCEPALRERMQAVVGYIDDAPGLIPDDVPAIGGLDDALLVDLAMESLRGELDEYADFCRYRAGEAARLGVVAGKVPLDRAEWSARRQEEILMERQLRRARGGSYAPDEGGAALFRVG